MDKFKLWLNNLTKGRYGSDELSNTLVLIGIVLMILGSVIGTTQANFITAVLAIALVSVAIVRIFSKEISKRRAENDKFLSLFRTKGHRQSNSIKEAEKERKRRIREKRKTHVLFNCPDCHADCWVPKGKGKIRITCPKCGSKFIGKT
jgi:hypothetical protein